MYFLYIFLLIKILVVIFVIFEFVICLLGKGEGEGGDIYLDFLYYGVVVFGYYEGIILFWGSRGF